MNQILKTNNDNDDKIKNNNNKLNHKTSISIFKIQFLVSIIMIIIACFLYFYYQYSIINKEKISYRLVDNYNISRLYANSNLSNLINSYADDNINFTVIGLIEIPKLDISYPILSNVNDELLKIAPCKISGPMPNQLGNLCIAGHNYDNYKFFSKISSLENNDEIIIYDINGTKESYFVFRNYEVSNNDLSPLENLNEEIKQVTLITCNNSNYNRVIVQAKK